jgi:hypothetical protein
MSKVGSLDPSKSVMYLLRERCCPILNFVNL